jgi:hypothetical protein
VSPEAPEALKPPTLKWYWKVRVYVGGTWHNWSDERVFTVEPVDTDPPM